MNTIRTDELKTMKTVGMRFTLINVLPADEFAHTRIPGARSIPLENPDFLDRVEQSVVSKDSPIVVYCASEDCPLSTRAAMQLEAAGFTNVSDYKGGDDAWIADQYRVPVA